MNDLYGNLDEKKRKLTKKPSSEKNLGDWFKRKGAPGKKGGWVDCNTCRDGKCKSCGRSDGEKRSKKPRCRPTPSACKGFKNEELHMDLYQIIEEEIESVIAETHTKKHEKELEKISGELNGASKMHKGQADRIDKILDQAEDPEKPVNEGEKDACYNKVKSRYKVWPSAYASGALVKCRKVGAANWGNSKKESQATRSSAVSAQNFSKAVIRRLRSGEITFKQAEKAYKDRGLEVPKNLRFTNENLPMGLEQIIREELNAVLDEKKKKKKACNPSKGKRFAKRVDGKCRSYGQKGQAKGGGDRIRPGTKKGDAYCARSAKIKKCKNPPCANALSRKKWKCSGSKSMKE